jgi:bacillithiol biosynthesis cysteine-adding enzyme BshC
VPEAVIKPDKKFRHSDLYLDFITGKESLKEYFFHGRAADVAGKIKPPRIDRETLCDVLERQNKSFNAKMETFRSIETLRQEETLVVFAGQQAGLYGGPLLTLYKAIGIVKKAVLLKAETGRPVVPVFWIACDDHDFEEINHTWYLNQEGKPEKISYSPESLKAVPVADICMDSADDYEALVEQTQKAFGTSDFTDDLYRRLFGAYGRDKCLVNAFARYLLNILPDFGLVLFCPNNKDIKTISRGFFKRLVEGHFRIKEILAESEQKLKNDGYHIQADKKESAVHLFYHDPERIPIHLAGDDFLVGNRSFGLPALLDLIDKYPEKFSPDVLTRPVWQSFMFPVVAQSGGPAEIAYFSQMGRLFELFNLVQPYIMARPAATIIEKRQQEILEEYDIDLADLTGDVEEVINKILSTTFPKEIEHKLKSFRDDVGVEYEELANMVIELFPNISPMTKQTFGKIDSALEHLEKKIYSHHKKQNDITRNRIYRLASTLLPNKTFQERSLNINQFIAKYGFGIIDFIVDNLDADTVDHQLIYLSEYKA